MALPKNSSLTHVSEGGVAGVVSKLESQPLQLAPAQDSAFNQARVPLIPIACWRAEDIRFAFDSSFVQPEMQKELTHLREIREELKKNLPAAGSATPLTVYPPITIFAHADPVGSDDYNKSLSGRRAISVYALLTRNTSLWEELFSTPLGNDQWNPNAINSALAALGDSDVSHFQSRHGLPATNHCDAATRKALFLEYMNQLCGSDFRLNPQDDFLAGTDPGGKGDYQGCSEFNPTLLFSENDTNEFNKPENHPSRNAANAPNRRVLVLLFEPLTKIVAAQWPCPRAKEGVHACRARFWSDGEKRRQPSAVPRRYVKTADTFACRFYDRLAGPSPCEGNLVVLADWRARRVAPIESDPFVDPALPKNDPLREGELAVEDGSEWL